MQDAQGNTARCAFDAAFGHVAIALRTLRWRSGRPAVMLATEVGVVERAAVDMAR